MSAFTCMSTHTSCMVHVHRKGRLLIGGGGLTVCSHLPHAEGSPIETEYLVCIRYGAAIECAKHLLCRLV